MSPFLTDLLIVLALVFLICGGLILLQRDASEAERIVRRCAANVVLAFKEVLQ